MMPPGNRHNIDEKSGLGPFKELLLSACGFSFEDVRERSLVASLHRRMAECNTPSKADYLALLRRDPGEVQQLVGLLTVNETYFFREVEQLRLLTESLIPEILAERSPQPLRILSAGCSSGEEPYSVAMLLRDIYGADCERLFSIVGVDLDASVIAAAGRGEYGKTSFRGLDPTVPARHFESAPGGYRLKEEVRRLVRFQTGNLLGGMCSHHILGADVVLYRNVSIYFPAHVQRDIFTRLAEGLNDGGYMVVGATETMHHNFGVLSLVERDNLFVFQKIQRQGPAQSRRKRSQTRVGSPAGPRRRVQSAAGRAVKGASPTEAEAGRKAPAPAADAGHLLDGTMEMLRQGRTAQALARLDELIQGDGGNARALAVKAAALLNDLRLDEARSACEDALDLNSLCLEASLMLGIIALQQGEADEALRRFREAIYLDGSCWPAHFYMAEILFAGESRKRALGAYRTAASILESGEIESRSREFFPLALNAEQCMAVCRHKLALPKNRG